MSVTTSWFRTRIRTFFHKFSYQAMATGRTSAILPPGLLLQSFRNRTRGGWFSKQFGHRGFLKRRHCDNEPPAPATDAK